MTQWAVEEWTPYEGINIKYFDTAEEVLKHLRDLSSQQREACAYTVCGAPKKEYEPAEFIKAFEKGEVT